MQQPLTQPLITVKMAVDEFLKAKYADGLKPGSIQWYNALLKVLASKFERRLIDRITANELRDFVVSIRQTTKSQVTFCDKVLVLHVFFSWCAAEYNLSVNPMAKIKQPSRPKPKPKAISTPDLVKLYRACPDTPLGRRDRAILKVLADTGIRAAGLVGLRDEDVNLMRRRLIVREKGDKVRAVPYSPDTGNDLARWLHVRPTNASAVFCQMGQHTGAPLTYAGLRQLVRRLAKSSGVSGRYNIHSFRHFAAREYLNNGGGLATLAVILGHAEVTTTASFYAVYDQDEISARHDQHSPTRDITW